LFSVISEAEIARGPGPRWLRIVLVALAVVYCGALVWHPAQRPGLRMFTFFSEATKLFTGTINKTVEYRLEGWSCDASDWQLLDPRAYFPLEADDKESRFQRLAYFYAEKPLSTYVMNALDRFVREHHANDGLDDGVQGPIGGIRVSVVRRVVPVPGTGIERYVYRPLDPAPDAEHGVLFTTDDDRLAKHCPTGAK
jgi:hypothetical protein